MDFYTFTHRTFISGPTPGKPRWLAPHWVVGHSPFDDVISSDAGHVVHIGTPSFVARWTYQPEQLAEMPPGQHLHDDELGLLVYEVSWVDLAPQEWQRWLLEACCAVAYARGEIAESIANEGTA